MIGIMTYDTPHRKTYDTLCLLKAKGMGEGISVFAEPFHYKKAFKPLFEHRAPVNNSIETRELCANFNMKYYDGFQEDVIPENSVILLCGAGIISQERIEKYVIINAHPGYLPNVRGLDALKWAIYNGQPIGVTTHRLGLHVDSGLIIDRKIVPLYYNDTFHAVAQRQYEMEVNMLVEAIEKVDSASAYAEPQNYPLRKRMPHEMEMRLLERFQNTIQKVAIEMRGGI